MLMEQLNYNLLFRWFVGLNMDDAIRDPTVFTKNVSVCSTETSSTPSSPPKARKRIEEVFGWMKSIGLLRKVRHRGL
jgi:hypothetical protein